VTGAVEVAEALARERLIAVIRLDSHARVLDVASVLVAAGVRFLEVTIERPGAVAALAQVVAAFGDVAVVGAGTVRQSSEVASVVGVGARFVVSPDVNDDVLAAARDAQVLAIPGAFTPSEVARAHDAQARLVKLFPASTGGPAHLAALRGPFFDVGFVPTGGVVPDNVRSWLAAGAVAVAMGSWLVRPDGDIDGLLDRARAAVAAMTP